MTIGKILVFVTLIEAMIQALKLAYDSQNHKANLDIVVSLVVGILACFLFRVDLFEMVGFDSMFSPLGSIFTGIIASRGSNIFHDLLKLVQVRLQGVSNGADSDESGNIDVAG